MANEWEQVLLENVDNMFLYSVVTRGDVGIKWS